MKRPNGYGSISKLPGNRRKPYRVRITTEYTIDPLGRARQTQRTLGTYATYQEAADALAAYNRNPLSLEPGITFAEIYRLWSAEKYETVSQSTRDVYSAAYNAVPMLHGAEFRKLRRNHLQRAIDTCGKNYPTLVNVVIVIGCLYRYAMQNDIVDKDYSRFIDLTRHKPSPDDEAPPIHTDFTRDEIAVLWENSGEGVADESLMLIYSGLRISEYLALTPEDIDTDARIVTVRKSKTRAGRRRVPIAQKTLQFWIALKERRKVPNPYSQEVQYRAFFRALQALTRKLGLRDHMPHDTRHTTATLLHEAGVDILVTKRILGHAAADVTEAVYTHVHDDELLRAIDSAP